MEASKIILVILNAVLAIIGITLLVLSFVYLETATTIYLWFSIVLVVLGSLGIVVGVIDVGLLVNIYALLVLIMAVADVVIGGTIFIARKQADHYVEIGIKAALEDYSKSNADNLTKFLDEIHQQFKCCGYNGPKDFKDHEHLTDDSTPDSCCTTVTAGCGKGLTNSDNTTAIYSEGCGPKIAHILLIFGIGALVFSSVKFVLFIVAFLGQGEEEEES